MDNVPKSRLFSISQLSKITGKDRATISTRLQDMKPTKEDGRAKYYDSQEALQVIYAAESFKGMQKKIEMVEYEIQKEKLHKVRIENEMQMGKLVPIAEVAKTVEREYSFVKAQLKSIPAKLSLPISMETEPALVNKMMMDEINQVLSELTADENYKKHLEEMTREENERNAKPNTTSVSTTDQPSKDSDTTTKSESS